MTIQKSFTFGDPLRNPTSPAGIYEYVVARTKFIDGIFQTIAGRFAQIFILGAGFDSRSLRFHDVLKGSAVYELDSPATQTAKTAQYAALDMEFPDNVTLVPIDFARQDLGDALRAAGARQETSSLFLLEGLIMYLAPPDVDRLFTAIAAYCGAGSQVVFDYVYASVLAGTNTSNGAQEGFEGVRSIGENWLSGIKEGALPAFLTRFGLDVIDEADPEELVRRYFTDDNGKKIGVMNGASALVMAAPRGEAT